MNKDQAKGIAKQVGGEVQEQAGTLTGDTSTTMRGHAREKEGKLQKKAGDAREALRHAGTELDRKVQKRSER